MRHPVSDDGAERRPRASAAPVTAVRTPEGGAPEPRSDREVRARALRAVRALRQLLEDERHALGVAEPRALIALAERKSHLLGTLEAMQPALGESLTRAAEDDEARREIVECLQACRRDNAENGVATAAAAHHVRSTLTLLRSTLALDDLTLYDERGELLIRRERRPLGRV